MGFETMRRWPVFVILAFTLLLCLSLLSSWANEAALQVTLEEMTLELEKCTKSRSSCMDESLILIEQRDHNNVNANRLQKEKEDLKIHISETKQKAVEKEILANRTQVDLDVCKTELQSLKNLQVSKSATLETLRLEKETLTSQLDERKTKIDELEKEVTRLKSALDGKTPGNRPLVPKMTPAAPPIKQSSVIASPLNKPAVENNAKEEDDDINTVNDTNFIDFGDDPNK